MPDTTIKKVDSHYSPRGDHGQIYLAMGTRLSMRLWREEPGSKDHAAHAREYETVGYVIAGKAKLHIEGQMVILEAGDSWVVPEGAEHYYEIVEPFEAVEATSPPAEVHGRDE